MTEWTLAPYTSDVMKTAAVIPEMIEVLRHWEPGLPLSDLRQRVVAVGALGRVSETRIRDIIDRSFKQRFLAPDDKNARNARFALDIGLDSRHMKELLFTFFVRTYTVAYDFLIERYWPAANAGHESLLGRDIVMFLTSQFGTRRLPESWTANVAARVGRNLGKALTDFGLFEDGKSPIRRFKLWQASDFLVSFILFEQHERGVGDTTLLSLPEWAPLGLSYTDVVDRCRSIGGVNGPFVFQYSGELAQFSWKNLTVEEYLREYVAA
jgi:hypothetical protein